MSHPMSMGWTEVGLSELLPTEHDFQEFKCARFVADEGRITPTFINSLSKQISAFANGAGGLIFLGIDDDGQIDGGVPVDLKPGGTRAWFEDVIPGSVEPALSSFNVFEVLGEGPGSKIEPGHAVYVLDVPTSDDAPHQAVDYRYYLRIAGKSRPMGNVHLQDVLRRTRHPHVDVVRVGPYGQPELRMSDERGPLALVCLQTVVGNLGQNLAHHVGVELSLPRPLVPRVVRSRISRSGEVEITQSPGEVRFFRYHQNPLFPKQEIPFQQIWVGLHSGNLEVVRSGEAKIGWRVYADDALPRESAQPLWRYGVVHQAVQWIEAQLSKGDRLG